MLLNYLPFEFLSSDHVRYQNGIDVSGHQNGNHRLIEIKEHPVNADIYVVTIYNLDGNHPVWKNNIQMAPKYMKIITSSISVIDLRGIGNDIHGVSFADYGITLNINSDMVESVILHIYDRFIDIQYFR